VFVLVFVLVFVCVVDVTGCGPGLLGSENSPLEEGKTADPGEW
jgi:hypothetical protein